MTSITYGSLGSLNYAYDADGQRTGVSGSLAASSIPAPQTFTYNADNSLAKVGSSTVSNDQGGNITCIGGSGCGTFSYDERGSLQQWQTATYAVDYSYDALGRRSEENMGGLAWQCYVYDGLNVVATTTDCSSGLGVSSFLLGTGLDELFMDSGNGGESYLRDALNSTLALTSSSAGITGQVSYDPYGNTTSSGSASSLFEFAGRESDTALVPYPGGALYYMRGRYYDPQIARFISRDPIGIAGGLNLYAYAGDDPVDSSDPTGQGCGSDCPPVTIGGGGGFLPLPGGGYYNGPSGFEISAVGDFQYQPLPLLANQSGLGGGIYADNQNGEGIASPEQDLYRRATGTATWYDCCNPTTSAGARFDPSLPSAAIRRDLVPRQDLPIFVIIRNLDSPKSKAITLLVTDIGGPALTGERIIDLTPAAFRALGLNPARTKSFHAEVYIPKW